MLGQALGAQAAVVDGVVGVALTLVALLAPLCAALATNLYDVNFFTYAGWVSFWHPVDAASAIRGTEARAYRCSSCARSCAAPPTPASRC